MSNTTAHPMAYYCHRCRQSQHSFRCSICGGDCEHKDDPSSFDKPPIVDLAQKIAETPLPLAERVKMLHGLKKVAESRPDLMPTEPEQFIKNRLYPMPTSIVEGCPSNPRAMDRLDLQTAISQWLRGRMLDEDPDCPLYRSAQACGRIWLHLTHPDNPPPYLLWDRKTLADAQQIFGHHFKN